MSSVQVKAVISIEMIRRQPDAIQQPICVKTASYTVASARLCACVASCRHSFLKSMREKKVLPSAGLWVCG